MRYTEKTHGTVAIDDKFLQHDSVTACTALSMNRYLASIPENEENSKQKTFQRFNVVEAAKTGRYQRWRIPELF